MRLVVLSAAADTWGAEESLFTLVRHFPRDRGDAVLIASTDNVAQRWNAQTGSDARTPGRLLGRVAGWIWFARQVGREARAGDQVIVFSLSLNAIAPLLRAIAFIKRANLVLDLHDYLPTRGGRAKLNISSRFYNSVIAISDFALTQVTCRRTAVLIRPIEPPRDLPRSVATRRTRRVVAVVGRLDPDKNLELGLDVARLMPAHMTLEFRGASSPGNELYAETLRQSSEAFERVTFAGRFAQELVLQGVDILLVTNHLEAMGRTVLEAQIRGIPVVVPDQGGAAGLVVDGETGSRYCAGSAQAAASAIMRASEVSYEDLEVIARIVRQSTSPTDYALSYRSCLERFSK